MDIVHGQQLQFEGLELKHRGGGLAFKHLFRGDESTPENYLLSLAHQGTFYSPLHRHNFDQFRYAYRGDVSLSPDLVLSEGELAYHPEGVSYGPQSDETGERDVLVLQFGGPSGQGYLSFAQLAQAQEKLKQRGRFEHGKYYPDDGSAPKDGYEALWENCTSRTLEYPAPRYHSVVAMKPENYPWVPSKESPNACVRLLGVFTERRTSVEMTRIQDGGQFDLRAENAIQLLFVIRGQGKVGETTLEAESAVRLSPNAGSSLSSSSEMHLLRFVLPMLRSSN